VEVGGALQHGAVVARGYGIPCVAGVVHPRYCTASLSVLPTTHLTAALMVEISPLSRRNFCSASSTE
jgi:hypothetical protein